MRKTLVLILSLLFLQTLEARGLRVAFVGDPQVDSEEDLYYARKSVYAELRARRDLDLVVFLGDMVNDDVRLLVPTRATLDSLPCPWACVPGNHDRDMYSAKKGQVLSFDGVVREGKARDMATYSRVIGAPDTTFDMGGVRFIMMDDVRSRGMADYEGGFRTDQKQWLRGVLAATPQDMGVVLSAHIPLREFSALDSLESILKIHPKMLLMCGHTHTMARHKLRFPGGLEVEEVLAGAACGSWWRGVPDEHGIPSATMNCGSPRSYYLADFTRSGYRLSAKVIGKDPSTQASAWISDSTRLVVNIYAGSVDGVVKVRVPGIKGWLELPRRSEPAPEEYSVAYFNKTIPGRKSRDPRYIPMLLRESPHVWALNMKNSPETVAALSAARGKKVRIRYEDPVMKFTAVAPLEVSPKSPRR